MQKRMYEAEVIESLIDDVKKEYTKLMIVHMKDEEVGKTKEYATAITALGTLEDMIFALEPEMLEIK